MSNDEAAGSVPQVDTRRALLVDLKHWIDALAEAVRSTEGRLGNALQKRGADLRERIDYELLHGQPEPATDPAANPPNACKPGSCRFTKESGNVCIHCGLEYEEIRPENVTVKGSPIGEAMKHLREAMRADPSYAWSWHCNLAMPMVDQGLDRYHAQAAAAYIMQTFFDIDTSKNPEFPRTQGKRHHPTIDDRITASIEGFKCLTAECLSLDEFDVAQMLVLGMDALNDAREKLIDKGRDVDPFPVA